MNQFFVIIDSITVVPLKATTYEDAFDEIDSMQGHTWVLDADALLLLQASVNDALGNGEYNHAN